MKLTRLKGGFVLFEVVLALSIFCVCAVAFTAALYQGSDTISILRDESQVRHELANILAESATLKLKTGTEVLESHGKFHYERDVEPLQAQTAKRQPVLNLINVTIRAVWIVRGQTRKEQAQVIMYQP
jgi:hypothetical protein